MLCYFLQTMGKKKGRRAHNHYASYRHLVAEDFSPEIRAKVSCLFVKKFTYDASNEDNVWKLPHSEDLFKSDSWKDPILQDIKSKLNQIKGKLSDIDINLWHAHTQNMNGAGDVINQIKRCIHPELCTQAWCKFHEIVNSFPIVPWGMEKRDTFSSLHLCEAPGAFITSLNHYLESTGSCLCVICISTIDPPMAPH